MSETLILVSIGLLAGVFSGMFGVGGGIIIVPALVFFLGMSQHHAQGTSIGIMLLPVGILGAMQYYKAGYLDIKSVLIISLAFIFGGYIGSKISIALSVEVLKKIFGIVMIVLAIRMIFYSN